MDNTVIHILDRSFDDGTKDKLKNDDSDAINDLSLLAQSNQSVWRIQKILENSLRHIRGSVTSMILTRVTRSELIEAFRKRITRLAIVVSTIPFHSRQSPLPYRYEGKSSSFFQAQNRLRSQMPHLKHSRKWIRPKGFIVGPSN